MKIICEHCGTSIDLDKDKICPNCKAPYSKNQDYNEYKENVKKEKNIDIKSKELDNEIKEKTKDIMDTGLKTFKSTFAFGRIMFIVVSIFALAIIITVIIHMINFDNDFNNSRDDVNNMNEVKNDSTYDKANEQYEKIKEELDKRYEEMENFR